MKTEYNWDEVWGMKYDPKLTEEALKPFLLRLEQDHHIGPVIFDIGCGAYPVSSYLTGNHKFVLIDISGEEKEETNTLKLTFDITGLMKPESEETQKVYHKIENFLGLDSGHTLEGRIDTVVLSNILNYFDYKAFLKEIRKLLKPNGRIILFNRPFKGGYHLASPNGLTNNIAFFQHLEETGFLIEECQSWVNPLFTKENEGVLFRSKNSFETSLVLFSARKHVEETYKIPPGLFQYENGVLLVAGGKLKLDNVEPSIVRFFDNLIGFQLTELDFYKRAKAFFNKEEENVYRQVAMDYFYFLIVNKLLEEDWVGRK
jgi:SAM-dependent methyltransferase